MSIDKAFGRNQIVWRGLTGTGKSTELHSFFLELKNLAQAWDSVAAVGMALGLDTPTDLSRLLPLPLRPMRRHSLLKAPAPRCLLTHPP